jgi:xylose isomerase
MDTLARGLRNAAAIIEDGRLGQLVEERYASWHSGKGIGAKILKGKVGALPGRRSATGAEAAAVVL